MGGFLLSKGMESTGAHTRIAVSVVRFVGADEPHRLIMGFMLAAALLSMWISNTATVLMLLPVALAVVATSNCTHGIRTSVITWLGLGVQHRRSRYAHRNATDTDFHAGL